MTSAYTNKARNKRDFRLIAETRTLRASHNYKVMETLGEKEKGENPR